MSWRFSHFARSPEMYEEPLSDNSLGRWRTLALSSAAASSAISSVAVTSSEGQEAEQAERRQIG